MWSNAKVARAGALTDIPGGTGIFGGKWSPRVGSEVLMGDGKDFFPIPYEYGPDSGKPERSHILIVTHKYKNEIEYIEFENLVGGKVIVKRKGEDPVHVAKVTQSVSGVGRFTGSEYTKIPGNIRANHAGVICFGTTDKNVDPNVPPVSDIMELMGGFQVVPSHHYQDSSMGSGGNHPFVYLVIGPIIDPPNLKRYDMGVDGQYPFFYKAFRAGTGATYFKFKGDNANWIELTAAVKAGKFKTSNGTVVKHLRGYIKDALVEVTAIRHVTTENNPYSVKTE
jgi:hypothetical protein